MSGGITAAGVGTALATGAAAAAGGLAVNAIGSAISGGGGSASGGVSGGSGSGGINTMQTQFANSVRLNQGPSFGGNKEPQTSNPDMPLQPTKAQPEKAASKWNINSTPAQAVGDEQAKQDSQNIWGDRLQKYLDYNSRSLG